MRFWHLDTDANNYDNLVPIGDGQWEKLDFDGTPRADFWEPIALKVIENLKISDSPSLATGVPIFSEKAVSVLKELMGNSVEILPVRCRRGDYFAINVLDIIDCIDYELAQVKRFKSSGRVMLFEKYAFHSNLVADKHIFKIPEEPKSYPIVSHAFKEKVEASDLVGFKFELIWDSED